MTIQLDNGSAEAIDLNQVVVTATYGDPARIASSVYDDATARDFSGRVLAGSAASGTYIFAVPVKERKKVNVTVDFDGTHAPAAFAGSVK